VDTEGRILAQAQASGAAGEIAQQPYFIRAMQGALGSGHGIYGTRLQRAYFFAARHLRAMEGCRGRLW